MYVFLYFLISSLTPKHRELKIYSAAFCSSSSSPLISKSYEVLAFVMTCGRAFLRKLPYKKMWSQKPNTSTFLLLASVFVHLFLQTETAVPTEMDGYHWCKPTE